MVLSKYIFLKVPCCQILNQLCNSFVYIYAPFVLPLNHQTDLVSPYYWIGVSRSYYFQKPVQIQFKHFTAVTNPSHYQLFACEDDGTSNPMQSVDYDLGVKVHDDRSWFTYLTRHFCSYCTCLLHNYKGIKSVCLFETEI